MGNANIALGPGPRIPSREDGNVQFDALKLQWVGIADAASQVMGMFRTVRARMFEDLRKEKTILGSNGVVGDDFVVPRLAGRLLGTKTETVTGSELGR